MYQKRKERLAFDYHEMMKLQNRPYLSWIVTKGEPPYAEEYLMTIKARTYALGATEHAYRVGVIRECTVRMTLWDSYPVIAPNTKMLNIPPVFHPDWYSKGTYCPSELWHEEDSLKDYVKRMIQTLTYEPTLIEAEHPANFKALAWYQKHRENTELFPSDTIELTENSPEKTADMEKAALSFGEVIDSWDIKR